MPSQSTKPPQQQATSHGTLGCMVIVLLCLLFLLVGVGYDALPTYSTSKQLAQESVDAPATIVADAYSRICPDDGGECIDRWETTYQFRGADGLFYQGDVTSSSRFTSPLTIRYAKTDPTVSLPSVFYRPPQQVWQEKSKLIFWLALPFLVALLWLWYAGRHHRQLHRQGQLVQGAIINRFTQYDGEGGDSYCVEYLFKGGVATVQMVTKALYDRLAVGAPVSILYLPADPKISCLQEN